MTFALMLKYLTTLIICIPMFTSIERGLLKIINILIFFTINYYHYVQLILNTHPIKGAPKSLAKMIHHYNSYCHLLFGITQCYNLLLTM